MQRGKDDVTVSNFSDDIYGHNAKLATLAKGYLRAKPSS
jgi:hypothetical protein